MFGCTCSCGWMKLHYMLQRWKEAEERCCSAGGIIHLVPALPDWKTVYRIPEVMVEGVHWLKVDGWWTIPQGSALSAELLPVELIWSFVWPGQPELEWEGFESKAGIGPGRPPGGAPDIPVVPQYALCHVAQLLRKISSMGLRYFQPLLQNSFILSWPWCKSAK